jgi:hypothetical protein
MGFLEGPRYIASVLTARKTRIEIIPSLLSEVLSWLLPSDGPGIVDARVYFNFQGNVLTGPYQATDVVSGSALQVFNRHVTINTLVYLFKSGNSSRMLWA